MTLPCTVRIVDVGPRDGLQNEARPVPAAIKVELIRRLVAAGLRTVEATAFVSPKWVPQMADASEVLAAVLADASLSADAEYPVLVPNLKGLEAALAAGARQVAVFAAASEAFSQKNINCSVAESLARFAPVLEEAARHGVRVRGYVSCALGCPYQGAVAPADVAAVAGALADLGCFEVSLGDTIGVGTPDAARRMLEAVAARVPVTRLAGHYHDTWGMAVANVAASLEFGVAVFDASVGGLGGCPYAPGASGNVATEDVVYLLHGLGIATGIDLEALVAAAAWISAELGRPPASKVARALLSKQGKTT